VTVKHLNPGDILSQAVEHAGVVHVAGLTADNLKADIKGQTKQVLDKIDAILKKMGTDKSKLLSATLYFTDIDDKPAANEVWKAWLGKHERPARAGIGVTLGTPDTLIEIMVTAAK